MAYKYSKKLNRRTVADKVLRDKAFDIAKNTKYDGYQSSHASMVCKPFDKKKTSGETVKNEIISNKELSEELHKPIIRKFHKSALTFYRQYLVRRSHRYAVDK